MGEFKYWREYIYNTQLGFAEFNCNRKYEYITNFLTQAILWLDVSRRQIRNETWDLLRRNGLFTTSPIIPLKKDLFFAAIMTFSFRWDQQRRKNLKTVNGRPSPRQLSRYDTQFYFHVFIRQYSFQGSRVTISYSGKPISRIKPNNICT